jgi:sortase A
VTKTRIKTLFKRPKLKVINDWLSVFVVILAIYIIVFPFLPSIWWKITHIKQPDLATVQVTNNSRSQAPIPDGKWLDIPRLKMHEQIHTGDSLYELNKGAWRIPETSTPDRGSNTVLAGHRFTYTSPKGVFYFLDKIRVNDKVTIYWQKSEYTYRVAKIIVVPSTAVEIQAPSNEPKLTLFTCTPLWTAKDRLVIQADLVAKRSS